MTKNAIFSLILKNTTSMEQNSRNTIHISIKCDIKNAILLNITQKVHNTIVLSNYIMIKTVKYQSM